MGGSTASVGEICRVVTLYWVVSISMVYANKYLISGNPGSVPAPLFVTWVQCAVTVAICYVCSTLTKKSTGKSSAFEGIEFSASQARKVAPLSMIFVSMIAMNNLCLQNVEVSFYNVARSLTLLFNVLLGSLFLGATTSIRTKCCLALVVLGFMLGTQGEVNYSLIGSIYGVLASVFVSLNAVFTKKVLPAVGNDHWRLTYLNNINACFIFAPLVFFFEREALLQNIETLVDPTFVFTMLLAGVFGFSIGIVTVMQIKATSPLTHNISGTAKAAAQSALAFYIWRNQPTLKGVLGIALVLLGSALYTYVQLTESERKKREYAQVPAQDKEEA